MNYPQMEAHSVKRTMVNAFKGYDHNLVTSDTTFYDMYNLSSDEYPALSTRRNRSIVTQLTDARGLISKDSLCWIDGNSVWYNGEMIDGITLNDELPKQMVSMGAYLVIFPDAVYVNTKNFTDHGNLGAKYELAEGLGVSVTVSRQDGSEYENLIVRDTAPESPSVGDYWIDTSVSPSVLKLYTYEEIWSDVPTSYCTISANGIGSSFENGDGIVLTASNNLNGLLPMNKYGAYTSSFALTAVKEDSITVTGIMNSAQISFPAGNVELTAERRIPTMDYVIESQNRLWGCYYGISSDGEALNEIYASALGDPKNWSVYQGTAADSYTVSLGSDGVFTGAIAYQNRPVFFKENYIHTIYGDYPSNYTMNTTTARGVQKGSSRSTAIVGGILYYKSPTDISAYDGSLPVSVSAQLGDVEYINGISGANGNKLYISFQDKSGVNHMFVYDAAKGIWSKQDDIRPIQFAGDSNELYFIDEQNRIVCVSGNVGAKEADFEWSFTTGILGFEDPDGKRVRQVKLNMLMDEDSVGTLDVMYDSSGEWQKIAYVNGVGRTKCTSIIFIPQLSDHYQLRLSGMGFMHLVSITKSTIYGGEKR